MKIYLCVLLGIAFHGACCRAQESSGIGVALKKEGEYVLVAKLLPDGPAALSSAIQPNDKILEIAQADNSPISVKGFRIEDVTPLLRGSEGSVVRITISSEIDPIERVVSLKRGLVAALADYGDGVLLSNGTKAPNMLMQTIEDHSEEDLQKYVGKIVVLEFWASWCGPCRVLMTELQDYVKQYPKWDGKVVLLAANVDDEMDAATKLLNSKGWHQTHNVRASVDAMKAFHVNALPTIYIIDQDGKVVTGGHGLDIPKVIDGLLAPR